MQEVAEDMQVNSGAVVTSEHIAEVIADKRREKEKAKGNVVLRDDVITPSRQTVERARAF